MKKTTEKKKMWKDLRTEGDRKKEKYGGKWEKENDRRKKRKKNVNVKCEITEWKEGEKKGNVNLFSTCKPNKQGGWWTLNGSQRQKILTTASSKQEALRLLHPSSLPPPVLSSFLSSPSSSPPPVCSRRRPLTAGDEALRWALTASSAGSGRWAVVTSAVPALPGPVSAVTPSLWRLAVSMVTGLSQAAGPVRGKEKKKTPVSYLSGAGKGWLWCITGSEELNSPVHVVYFRKQQ